MWRMQVHTCFWQRTYLLIVQIANQDQCWLKLRWHCCVLLLCEHDNRPAVLWTPKDWAREKMTAGQEGFAWQQCPRLCMGYAAHVPTCIVLCSNCRSRYGDGLPCASACWPSAGCRADVVGQWQWPGTELLLLRQNCVMQCKQLQWMMVPRRCKFELGLVAWYDAHQHNDCSRGQTNNSKGSCCM